MRLDLNNLVNSDIIFPAIAHVTIKGKWQHYVVIHKISKNKIIIADPAVGIVKYNIHEFKKIWNGILILLEPTNKICENKRYKKSVFSFYNILVPYRKTIIKLFIPSVTITVVGVFLSLYFSYLVENMNSFNNICILMKIFAFFILLLLFKCGIEIYRNRIMLKLNQELDSALILESYNHLLQLPISFYESRRVGDITSRFTDASKIREALSSVVLTLMVDIVLAIVGGIVLLCKDKILFGIVLVTALIYAVSASKFNRFLKNANKKQFESNGKFISFLTESVIGYGTIKVNQFENHAKNRLKLLHKSLMNNVFKVGIINSFQQFSSEFLLKLGETAVVSLGILRVTSGALALGDLIAFNSLLIYFFEPIRSLVSLQPMIQSSIVAYERLSDILDSSCENMHTAVKQINFKSNIKFLNVFFSYDEEKSILNGLTFDISLGQRVAFVGESGCGKTTIAKLLLRLYSRNAGGILIDNKNIENIPIEILRNRIREILI